MPATRRLQRTLLPGFGVAAAVLAAVMIVIPLAADLVRFDRWSGNPAAASEKRAIVLGALASQPPPAAARRTEREPPARAAAAAPPRAPAPAPPRRPATAATNPILERPSPPPELHIRLHPLPPPDPLPPGTTRPIPRAGPLEPVANVVTATTNVVATTLRAVTAAIGKTTVGISPTLGTAVTAAGDALGDVVDSAGVGVRALLAARVPGGVDPAQQPVAPPG